MNGENMIFCVSVRTAPFRIPLNKRNLANGIMNGENMIFSVYYGIKTIFISPKKWIFYIYYLQKYLYFFNNLSSLLFSLSQFRHK